MSRDDDARDVERVMAGDTEAFAGIVRRNEHVLLAFGRRFFTERSDVEDFVQEVFLRAYRRIGTYRGEARVRSWLLGIAYRMGQKARMRGPEYGTLEAELLDDARDTPEQGLLKREARRTVLAAIRDLPERFATCIYLFFFCGMTYAEISGTTGHPLNTVRSHIRRAKRSLRDALAGDTTGGMP